MASTYLTRTFGTATNRLKGTFSFWVKRSVTGSSSTNMIFHSWNNVNYRFQIYFQGGTNADRLALYNVDSGSANMYFETNAKYRDVNAWYHIYIAVDTTLSTQGDRLKFYVNGERITSFAQETYPAQNADMSLGASSYTNLIGQYGGGGENFNGSMSHYYFVDGSVIDVGQFGSTDSTTGEWKINTNPTISSYGNQGFLILKDGNTITDQSPNSNNFTVGGGTLTKTEDNPSNVFATLNPLDNYYLGGTFAMGNNRVTTIGNRETFTTSTLGMNSGKWYFETYASSSSYDDRIGISAVPSTSNTYHLGSGAYAYGYSQSDGNIYNNNSGSSYGNNWSSTDGKYIGCYLDLDNNKIYFNIDGVVQNSGTGFSITPASSTSSGFYHFAVGEKHSSYYSIFDTNFGNGSFGSTQLTGTTYSDNNNQGIFKYNPSGTFDGTTKHFLALSTKGLNT